MQAELNGEEQRPASITYITLDSSSEEKPMKEDLSKVVVKQEKVKHDKLKAYNKAKKQAKKEEKKKKAEKKRKEEEKRQAEKDAKKLKTVQAIQATQAMHGSMTADQQAEYHKSVHHLDDSTKKALAKQEKRRLKHERKQAKVGIKRAKKDKKDKKARREDGEESDEREEKKRRTTSDSIMSPPSITPDGRMQPPSVGPPLQPPAAAAPPVPPAAAVPKGVRGRKPRHNWTADEYMLMAKLMSAPKYCTPSVALKTLHRGHALLDILASDTIRHAWQSLCHGPQSPVKNPAVAQRLGYEQKPFILI